MKPLAITLGDPAGIGAEVAAKIVAADTPSMPWLLVGTRWALDLGAESAGVTLPDIKSVFDAGDLANGFGLYEISVDKPEDFQFGVVDAAFSPPEAAGPPPGTCV